MLRQLNNNLLKITKKSFYNTKFFSFSYLDVIKSKIDRQSAEFQVQIKLLYYRKITKTLQTRLIF